MQRTRPLRYGKYIKPTIDSAHAKAATHVKAAAKGEPTDSIPAYLIQQDDCHGTALSESIKNFVNLVNDGKYIDPSIFLDGVRNSELFSAEYKILLHAIEEHLLQNNPKALEDFAYEFAYSGYRHCDVSILQLIVERYCMQNELTIPKDYCSTHPDHCSPEHFEPDVWYFSLCWAS